MALTDATVVGVAPDISLDVFRDYLREQQSPALGDALTVYAECVSLGVSPSYILAQFTVESRCGREGTATITHSWGNTRPPSFGVPDIGTVPGRSGEFSRYASWGHGGIATVARLVEHKPYAGKTTVRQIIPIWAPAKDGNEPTAYINSVLVVMERLRGRMGTQVPGQMTDTIWLVDIQGRPNSPDRAMPGGVYTSVTIHETDNENPGATARMHRQFVQAGGGPGTASFQCVVDGTESLQIMPWDQAAYHTGRGDDDEAACSIGIEVCVNSKVQYPLALRKAATVAAKLLLARELPLVDGQTLRDHGSWWSPQFPEVHRNCPRHLRAGDWGVTWPQFVGWVREAMATPGEDRPTLTTTIDASGAPITVIRWAGKAKRVLGTNAQDIGVSVIGMDDATYHRSVQANQFKDYVREG